MLHHLPDQIDIQDILLRPIAEADFPAIMQQLNDPQIAEWLAAIPQPFGHSDAQQLRELDQCEDAWLRAIVFEKKFAGCLCLGTNTWFWLDRENWQNGLMTKALGAALTAYFSAAAAPLMATARDDNTPSRALMTRLGFSLCPDPKRLFFHGAARSFPCRDFILTPEQWHLLHPPSFETEGVTIKPATQRNATELARLLPLGAPWPDNNLLPVFLEDHRFRGRARGLFVIYDKNRQLIGAALAKNPLTITTHLVAGTPDKLAASVADTLATRLSNWSNDGLAPIQSST